MLQPPEAVQDFFCDKASSSVVGIVNYEKKSMPTQNYEYCSSLIQFAKHQHLVPSDLKSQLSSATYPAATTGRRIPKNRRH